MSKVVDERMVAAAAGLKVFESSVPCRKAGHVGKRYTVNGGCLGCLATMKVEIPKPVGAKPYVHPQMLNLNMGLSREWGAAWSQAHTDAATKYLQNQLNVMLHAWNPALPLVNTQWAATPQNSQKENA